MDYTIFLNYPLQILGIDESYDSELTAIENFVIFDLEYSGAVEDLEEILPYFVFFHFCENRKSEVSAMTGEQSKVAEFTVPSVVTAISVWNIGVKKLNTLLLANEQTVNELYTSKISLI
jgi:hypothetical protein